MVAGLDRLYRRFGSGKVAWADLIAPAIEHAEQGFILDEALPTTIAEGRRYFEKYPAARRIFLPDGRVPLILVSDNNFAATQATQFIVLAVELEAISPD